MIVDIQTFVAMQRNNSYGFLSFEWRYSAPNRAH